MMTPAPIVKVYYGKPMLPDVSRVLACLYEKDVKFDLIDMYEGQQINPDLIKFQASRAPVSGFEDGTTRLFESRAICRHIIDKYADRGNKYLLGRDLLERASIEQWLKSEEHSFDPPSWALVFHLAFNVAPDQALVTQSERKLSKVLDVYEQRLAESKFLAGDEFSLADLSHLPNSHYLARSREWGHLFESRKNVSKWWEEISSRNSWQEVVKILNEVGLLKDDKVSSNGGYQFLTHNKLDLRSPAEVSTRDQEQATQQAKQENSSGQNVAKQGQTDAQSSIQKAPPDATSSKKQEQNSQSASSEDSAGQSILQQQATVDAQSSTKPPTPGALPRQKIEENSQKTPQDSSSKTTAKQSLEDAQSSTEVGGLDGTSGQKQEQKAELIGRADDAGEVISQQPSIDSTSVPQSPTLGAQAGQKQEQNAQQTFDQKSSKQAPSDVQPSPQQAPRDAMSMQTEMQDSWLTDQAGTKGQPISRQAAVEAQTSKLPTSGDQSSQKQDQDTKKTLQERSSAQTIKEQKQDEDTKKTSQEQNAQQAFDQKSSKQGPGDVQPSPQKSPRDAMSMQKEEQDAPLTGQADTKGQPISQQAAVDAQTSKLPTSGDQSSQKQDQDTNKTLQERSSAQTIKEQKQDEDTKKTSQERSSAQTIEDQGPHANSREKEENAQVTTRQADSPGQSVDQQGNAEGKSSNAQKSTESTSETGITGGSNNQPGSSTQSKD